MDPGKITISQEQEIPMRLQRFVTQLFVLPVFVILLVVLLMASWTIERFQLIK